MNTKPFPWLFPVSLCTGIAFAFLAILAGLWALFCFIGGPDGRFGSKDSIVAGCVSLAILALFLAASITFIKAAQKKNISELSQFYTVALYFAPVSLITVLATAIILSRIR